MASYDIFISYRRTGGFELAEVLYNRLTSMGYKVFLDIESLRSGKFNEALLQQIDECTDILLLLPPNALDRCVNADDWVRKEITWAIAKKKNIIPIYMNGFIMPELLPDGMEELPDYNAIIASTRTFDQTLAEIVSFLHSKNDSPTNSSFMKIASWVNHNILIWRIIFFPIAAFIFFELFMILPLDALKHSKSSLDEANFAACRMLYLVLSSTLAGCVLWLIPKVIKNMIVRFLISTGSILGICYLSRLVTNLLLWNKSYELWNTPLGYTLFLVPWLVVAIAILVTFIVKLIFVYFLEIE